MISDSYVGVQTLVREWWATKTRYPPYIDWQWWALKTRYPPTKHTGIIYFLDIPKAFAKGG